MSKILIIEDETMLAQMYRDVFEAAGNEVFTATGVDEAIDIAKNNKPDLVLLDILLPGETGISFLLKLRRLDDNSIAETPVVAFSNYDDKESKDEALRLGAKDYLIKTDHTPKEILEKSIKYIQ